MADVGTRGIIEDVTGKFNFDTSAYRASQIATIFRAVANAKRLVNNGGVRRTVDAPALTVAGGGMGIKGKVRSAADLNELNRKFYSSQG
jgi:hypothetical protein